MILILHTRRPINNRFYVTKTNYNLNNLHSALEKKNNNLKKWDIVVIFKIQTEL